MSTEGNTFEGIPNFRAIPGTVLFRSARPDKATENDVNMLKKLGVKRIVDFRTCITGFKEYSTASGQKLVDDVYQGYLLKTPNKKLSDLKYYKIDKRGVDLDSNGEVSISGVRRAHILYDVQEKYMSGTLKNYSRMTRWFVLLLLLIDKICGTVCFFRFIVWYSINPGRVLGSYIDTLNYCGPQICKALKLFSEKENIPAVICCTLGKDRTGIMAALLQAVVGIDTQNIARDYEATQEHYNSYVGDLAVLFTKFDLHKSFGDAEYGTMMGLFDYIRLRYGSVPNYLKHIGLSEDDQKKLRQNIQL